MSTLNNPEYLPKDRLKTELKKHGVAFNNNENKDYYVQLYRKHVLKGKAKQQQRSEFSSDEEFVRHSPRLTRRQQVTSTTASTTSKRKVANIDTYLPQIQNLTDQELMDELIQFGEDVGPITSTTRNVYLRKLAKLIATKTVAGKGAPPPDDVVDSGHHDSYIAEWSSEEESDLEEQEEEEPAHLTRSRTAQRAQVAQEKPSSTKYQIKESYHYSQQSPAVGREPGLRERRPQSTKSKPQLPVPRRPKAPKPSTIGSLLCSLLLLVVMFAAAFLVYEHLTCEEGKQSLAIIGWTKVKEFAIKVIPESATVTTTTTAAKQATPTPRKKTPGATPKKKSKTTGDKKATTPKDEAKQ